ncbi:molecular chaperone GrpE [Virgibacillus subterraneus]|uniref:Protein GrpE n=2 Tax=Virgibacillus TaxID=84406 RepID=A0A1H1B9F7_9BACI|nr:MULTISPECIES: nucleotide exchange factor GrpE [Virgibacillus]SDQ48539.1 molecular chaperone GrpE [Virgibacillus salinus]SEQ17337.1 molecular chaperone GrpE [Virgibacillus subterraneus]
MEEQNRDTTQTTEKDEENITEVIDNTEQDGEQQMGSDESKMESLKAEVDQLKQEKDELHQRVLRTQAEFDNFKKRSQKEKEAERKYKAEDIVNELLPAIDNFERALQADVNDASEGFVDGISMVYRQLKDALKAHGVEEIECVGETFDPTVHHAVMQVEEEDTESNTVTEELQKGYMLKDKVIRPAMVKVNK